MPDKDAAKLIFLIGMPAVGKTYWGGRIAKHYHLPFTDLDAFITQQEHASVPALFAQYGENGFREREYNYLQKLITSADETAIIACGGGTPCFNNNMQLLLAAGTVIYLRSDIPWLLNNLQEDTVKRPLLNNRGDLQTYLADMLQKRAPFYEQAHHILPVQDISLSTFDKMISSCINKH